MAAHLPHLHDLIADWQRRLRACRCALRETGESGPQGQLLLIHERVLCYLIGRYQRRDEPSDDGRPTVSVPLMQRKFPIGTFCWYETPEAAEPSQLHPPRSPAQLSVHLRGIHASLSEPPARRPPWVWRWRPRLKP